MVSTILWNNTVRPPKILLFHARREVIFNTMIRRSALIADLNPFIVFFSSFLSLVHNPEFPSLPHHPLSSTHTRDDQYFQEEPTSLNLGTILIDNDKMQLALKGHNSKKISKQNIVSTRSHGKPKVNDVTVNNDIPGMTVKPCNIHLENNLITWKQINEDKIKNKNKQTTKRINENFEFYELKDNSWSLSVEQLNQTYLIRESDDAELNEKVDGKEFLLSTSPVRFNVDITCASTPVSLKEININAEEVTMIDNKELIKNTFNDDEKRFNTYVIENSQDIILINELTPLENFCSTHFKSVIDSPISLSRNLTSDSLDSINTNEVLMKNKLMKKMNLLRDTTDSMISSIETSNEWKMPKISADFDDQVQIEQSNEFAENKIKTTLLLPNIQPNRKTIFNEQTNCQEREMPYWRKIMKNSTSRLINHLMKNPRDNFLPPVVQMKTR